MQKAIVKEIGKQALKKEEPIIILFGDKATDELKKVSVIQEFETTEPIDLKVGGTLVIGKNEYTIERVGRLAKENLNTLGHITLVFQPAPIDEGIVSGVYLSPHVFPEISKGTTIVY